jgi:hypothetical protein
VVGAGPDAADDGADDDEDNEDDHSDARPRAVPRDLLDDGLVIVRRDLLANIARRAGAVAERSRPVRVGRCDVWRVARGRAAIPAFAQQADIVFFLSYRTPRVDGGGKGGNGLRFFFERGKAGEMGEMG